MTDYFCRECGTKLNSEQAYCPNCGTPLKTEGVQQATEPVKPVVSKKPMSKKNKMIASIIAILAVLLIGGHFLMTYISSNDRQLTNIYNAVMDGNFDAFIAEVDMAPDPIYTEKSFMANLKQQNFSNVYIGLEEAVNRVRESGLTETIADRDGIDLFRVKQTKLLFFYPKATIELVGHELVINTDLENTTVTLADQSFELDGEAITVQNILPDDYTVGLTGEHPFFKSEGTLEVIREQFAEELTIILLTEDYGVKLGSVPKGSILFINDTSTKKTVEEFDVLAPVFDEKTVVHAVRKLEGKETEASEKETLSKGETVEFTFPLLVKSEADKKAKAEKDARTKVEEEDAIRIASMYYSEFRSVYEDALNYQTFSYIEPYLYGTGEAYEELSEFIADIEDYNYNYNFITNEIKGGSIKKDQVHLDVYEVFVYESGSGDVIRYERDKEYVLIEVSPEVYEIVKIKIKNTDKAKD